MPVKTASIQMKTLGFCDIHDITPPVSKHLQSSGLKDGILTVFVTGSTAGITTIEYESGVVEDLKKAIERMAPRQMHYDHDARWGDGNGFSHVRAALLGPSLSVPFLSGKMQLGTWQQIVLVDFDNGPRNRNVAIQIVGE